MAILKPTFQRRFKVYLMAVFSTYWCLVNTVYIHDVSVYCIICFIVWPLLGNQAVVKSVSFLTFKQLLSTSLWTFPACAFLLECAPCFCFPAFTFLKVCRPRPSPITSAPPWDYSTNVCLKLSVLRGKITSALHPPREVNQSGCAVAGINQSS